jgi:hypothetical protein
MQIRQHISHWKRTIPTSVLGDREQKAPRAWKARRAASGALALWFGPEAPAGASGLKSTADGLHYTMWLKLSSGSSPER